MSVNDRKILVSACILGMHGSLLLALYHSKYWFALAFVWAVIAIFQFDVNFKGEK